MIRLIALLATIVFACAIRGPHHPRGATPVKRHSHYTPHRGDGNDPQKLTQDEQLLHDTEHIQEHLEEVIDHLDLSKMTDEELEFYYFHLHDSDKNEKLDGLEILQAVYHTAHDWDDPENDLAQHSKGEELSYYVELIDNVLTEDDTNADGYLSYIEYVAGRKRNIQRVLKNKATKQQ